MALRVVRDQPDSASSGIRIEAANGHWFVAMDEVDLIVRALTEAADRVDARISTAEASIGNWFAIESGPPYVRIRLAFSDREFRRGTLGMSRTEFEEERAGGLCGLTSDQARLLASQLADAKTTSEHRCGAELQAWSAIETVDLTKGAGCRH